MHATKPRVAIFSLSSDFGCQVQLSNFPEILDTLSTFDLVYWQLVTSAELPDTYDVAVIEGAVTTDEQVVLLKTIRETASCVVALGACAATGGVPALVRERGLLEEHAQTVYGPDADKVAKDRREPAPLSAYIEVDFVIPGCPIEPLEFSRVLQRALRRLVDNPQRQSLCGECKISENTCFWLMGTPCLGLVARSGCEAMCVSSGRPCAACRGLARDANLDAARDYAAAMGCDAVAFGELLAIYNAAQEYAREHAAESAAGTTGKREAVDV
ncbi:MAG: NADH:ubiquinone oxidoreductase [Coriobacteriia bacterium]|nr:NADH:ubiquinone oxidoreductase [Coriobacteriia bacterium]